MDLAESCGAGSNHIREKDGMWAVCLSTISIVCDLPYLSSISVFYIYRV